MKKKIIVCGSIGFGGLNELKELNLYLKSQGFKVIDHITKNKMDYSAIKDFRNNRKLSMMIVDHDLAYINEADIVIVLGEKPSFGTAIEQYYAFKNNKTVILYSEYPIPTPWPVYFSDNIVTSKIELIRKLKEYNHEFHINE